MANDVTGGSPRAPMPMRERAKIFMPFNPLKGFHEALRAKELEVELAVLEGERAPLDDAEDVSNGQVV